MDNGMYQYKGYQLDSLMVFELTERDMQLLDACIFLTDNDWSIRITAENTGYSKSSLHRYIHSKLRKLSYELYKCTVRVLINHNKNKR